VKAVRGVALIVMLPVVAHVRAWLMDGIALQSSSEWLALVPA
jgi:hypothetical protein